jgi:hypothetical protein
LGKAFSRALCPDEPAQPTAFANQTVDVSPKKDRKETWEWHIQDTDRRTLPLTGELVKMLAGHAKFETTRQFYLAVRPDAIDRARIASEASRKGDSVAHLLRGPSETDQQKRLQSVNALKPIT